MSIAAEIIIPAAARNRAYAEKLLDGVAAAQFARKPPGINLNHAAFNTGHLAIYFSRILNIAGLDGTAVETPSAYTALFQHGAACQDDPQGGLYPGMSELTSAFFRGYDFALKALPGAADQMLAAAPNDGRMASLFPSAGAAVNYLFVNHIGQHLGQLSAWRRCMGLAGVM